MQQLQLKVIVSCFPKVHFILNVGHTARLNTKNYVLSENFALTESEIKLISPNANISLLSIKASAKLLTARSSHVSCLCIGAGAGRFLTMSRKGSCTGNPEQKGNTKIR